MKSNSVTAIFVAVILTFVAANVLAAPQQINIVNGQPVKQSEAYAKHTVALGLEGEMLCTAVIIHENFVLTAAHCNDFLEDAGYVYFGTDISNFISRKIIKVTAHADYCNKESCGSVSSEDDNDIMMVQFEGGLPIGFSPVPIAPFELLTAGQIIHVAGFGMNEKDIFEGILKVAKVPFLQWHGQSEFTTDEKLAGSCAGDSGGPAYVEADGKLFLAGITSRGDDTCRTVGVYTLVDFYSLWIYDIIMASELENLVARFLGTVDYLNSIYR